MGVFPETFAKLIRRELICKTYLNGLFTLLLITETNKNR